MTSKEAFLNLRGRLAGGLLRPLVLIVAVAILSPAAFTQNVPCSTERVLVTVVDGNGNPVRGLQLADFRAKSHHSLVSMLSVTPWAGPARVLLLFDGSGSMDGWLPLEHAAGLSIMRQAPPGVSFAMILFASTVDAKLPFTEGSSAAAKGVNALDTEAKSIPKNKGKTALFDAIEAGIKMFGQPRVGDTICVMTDGFDDISRSSSRQAAQALLASGVRLFGILIDPFYLGDAVNTSRQFNLSRQQLDEEAAAVFYGRFRNLSRGFRSLTQASGGIEYDLLPQSALQVTSDSPSLSTRPSLPFSKYADFCRMFDQQVASAYVVKVRFTANFKEREKWELEVTRQHGKPNRHVSVFCPRFLLCSEQR